MLSCCVSVCLTLCPHWPSDHLLYLVPGRKHSYCPRFIEQSPGCAWCCQRIAIFLCPLHWCVGFVAQPPVNSGGSAWLGSAAPQCKAAQLLTLELMLAPSRLVLERGQSAFSSQRRSAAEGTTKGVVTEHTQRTSSRIGENVILFLPRTDCAHGWTSPTLLLRRRCIVQVRL